MLGDLVLIADDDEGIRNLLTEVLSTNGYLVEVVQNGEEAIERFHKCVPSVVLLDSKMPKISGVKVAEKLKSLSPELPIIMISGYSEQEDIKIAQQKGFINYCLAKPFDIYKIIESIHLMIHAS